MKLMMIDGNSLVNRAFYGVRMLNAPDGTPTNAVYGFLNIYRKLMAEESPDAVCVAFDLPAPTFRHEMYDGYKAQRKGMPDELAAQMPLLKETLDAMNVRRCEASGWEADDLIGTAAARCAGTGDTCVIVTGDKDSFQLIDDHTAVRHVKTRIGQTETKLYDEAAFFEEYGFPPAQMVDLKALMGDPSDNIPGVPGVGEKTAMALVRQYGTVERIYGGLDTLDIKDSVRKKLAAGKDSADMSYTLATISRDAPIDFTAEDARVREPDNDRLFSLFQRLGFKKLIEAFSLRAPETAPAAAEKPFTGVCTSVEVMDGEALGRFRSAIADELCGVRFSPDGETCYIDCGDTGFIIREASPVYREALEALCAGSVRKAGHGLKDTVRDLAARGFPSAGWEFDTEIAAYLLDPLMSRYELPHLTEKYGGFTIAGETEDSEQLSLLCDDARDTARYLSEAAAVLALREVFLPELKKQGLMRVFEEIEMPLIPVLADMERVGMLVDRDAIAAFGTLLSAEAEKLQTAIYDLAGGEFNILSPKQLGQVLFDKLLLPAPKKTKTGYSTNADVLEKLRMKHPIVPLVLDYRQLTKLKSTYCDGLLKVVGDDGRIHTNFQMTVTATGRLSSTEPNLQNIPVRRALGGEMRKMFVAPEGYALVDADYSQIELRLLAHISGDETMINAFKNGEDIHAVTAAQVLGIEPAEVTPEQRRHAKAVNFGIVYGISAFSLAQDIGTSVAEAQRYMDGYLEKYAGVREYMKRVVSEAKERGCVTTLYGRRRPLPEIVSSNRNLAKFGERVALNAPIQGTAADIMKLAMIRAHALLKKEAPGARLIMQVHDELIAECPEEDADKVKRLLREAMEETASLSVPLNVEASSGKSWYEAK